MGMAAMAALLLPTEAIVLVLVAAGIATIVGARRVAGSLIGLFFLLALLPAFLPFLDLVLDAMPLWLLLIAGIWLVFAIVGSVMAMVFGRDVSNVATGHVLGTAIVGAFRLLFLPFRLFFRRRP